MESRKDQLQKQIIEALKANDSNLYSLLKSQWAHRFGVESLEELEQLDLTLANQKQTNEDNYKDGKLQDDFAEVNKEIPINEDNKKEKEIKNETNKVIDSMDIDNKESFEIKSYEIAGKQNYDRENVNPAKEYNIPPKVEALIPLPPKPKYNYLKKWLLKS